MINGDDIDEDLAPGDFPTWAPTQRFPGDTGQLSEEACLAYQDVLRQELTTAASPHWHSLLSHQEAIKCRLNELNLVLVIDPDRGYAYKKSADTESGYSLLASKPLTTMDTAILLYLRLQHSIEDALGNVAEITLPGAINHVQHYQHPESTNDTIFHDKVQASLSTMVKYGLLVAVDGTDRYLVHDCIPAAFPLAMIQELHERLLAMARGPHDGAGPAGS